MIDQSRKKDTKTAANSIVSHSKPRFLGIFSCCSMEEAPGRINTFKKGLDHPSSSIDLDKPPLKSDLTSQTDIGSFDELPKLRERSNQISNAYPVDRVFILGKMYKIVAKITTKRIFNNLLPQMPSFGTLCKEYIKQIGPEDHEIPNMMKSLKKEKFSLFDKGIKATEWHEITPESIAIWIAKRLQCDIMVDALCGYGGNTIQFAKKCGYVLGIDIDPDKTANAQHNAKIYGVSDKIDFITVDFLKLRNLLGDVVFLAPSDTRQNPNEPYSIFEHADPNLRELLAKSLEISYSITIQLPEDVNIDELAELFHVSLEQYSLYSKRFCIEIEQIVNSRGKIECIVVYFGECSSIDLQEEYEAIYEYLAAQESNEWRNKYPFHTVVAVLRSLGTRKFLMYLTEIEEKMFTQESINRSLFDLLLDSLIEKNIFTKSSLDELLDEGAHSAKAYLALLPKKRISRVRTLKKLPSNLSLETRDTSEPTLVRKPSFRKQLTETISEAPLMIPHEEEDFQGSEIEEDDDNYYDDDDIARQEFDADEDIVVKEEEEDDVSELSVSSYSVSSDYLKDSDSSTSKEYKKDDNILVIGLNGSETLDTLPKEDYKFLKAKKKGVSISAYLVSDKENYQPKNSRLKQI